MEKGLGVPVEDLTERERWCRGCRAGGAERQPDGGAQTLATAEVDLQLEHAAERGVVAAQGCRAMAPGRGVGAPASREVRKVAERRCGEGGGGVGGGRPGVRRGSLIASGGRRERPTICHPSAPVYIPRVICRGGS